MPKINKAKKSLTVIDFVWCEPYQHNVHFSDGTIVEVAKREVVNGKTLIVNERAYKLEIPPKQVAAWNKRHQEYLQSTKS